jgi:hypothetical protein
MLENAARKLEANASPSQGPKVRVPTARAAGEASRAPTDEEIAVAEAEQEEDRENEKYRAR